jgi:HEAT repeat protein
VRTSMELPGADVTKALTSELGQLPADNQIVVLQVLGLRGDAAALPVITTAAKSGPKAVRLAAIKAIPMIGQASAAPALIELLGDAEREIAQTAQESLAALQGKQVDAAVMGMLSGSDSARRVTAIELIARRRMMTAMPALQKAAGDADATVRSAALKRLGEMGTVAELPLLLDVLLQAKGQDLDAAEQAVGAVCAKAENPESCAEKIAGLVEQAQPAAKGALLNVLSAIGGAKALQAVRAAVSDSNVEVRSAAIRALGSWKTADAAPDLLAAAQSASDAKNKMVCLRSYFELASHAELPADQRLSMARKAAPLIESTAEKKLLLGALGNIATADSLAMAVPYLDDAAAKEEACAAVVSIGDKLLKGRAASRNGAKLIEPLQKAAQTTGNADLAKRANALLEQAQGKAGAK